MVECLPTMHKALDSVPSTSRRESALEEGSVDKVLIIQVLALNLYPKYT